MKVTRSNSFGSVNPPVPELTDKQYLTTFLNDIRRMPSTMKMAQVGIEPSVLGIPSDGPSYDKVSSFFSEEPFLKTDTSKIPKQWQEISNPQPAIGLISTIPDLTLFFIFYSQPKDLIQVTASQELQNRGWSYSDYKWTHIGNDNLRLEFDINSWSIREFSEEQQDDN